MYNQFFADAPFARHGGLVSCLARMVLGRSGTLVSRFIGGICWDDYVAFGFDIDDVDPWNVRFWWRSSVVRVQRRSFLAQDGTDIPKLTAKALSPGYHHPLPGQGEPPRMQPLA